MGIEINGLTRLRDFMNVGLPRAIFINDVYPDLFDYVGLVKTFVFNSLFLSRFCLLRNRLSMSFFLKSSLPRLFRITADWRLLIALLAFSVFYFFRFTFAKKGKKTPQALNKKLTVVFSFSAVR